MDTWLPEENPSFHLEISHSLQNLLEEHGIPYIVDIFRVSELYVSRFSVFTDIVGVSAPVSKFYRG